MDYTNYMKQSEFLLELYSEEIPSFLQNKYANIFKENIETLLSFESIGYSNIESYSGPCRITIYIEKLSQTIPSKESLIKGPKTSAPQIAIDGFCNSNSVKESDLITDNGYYFIKFISKEISIKTFLEEKIPALLKQIIWPKSMYWGDYDIPWIRPLKNILCLFDKKIVEFSFGHLKSNNITFAHKFLASQPKHITAYTEYSKFLEDNFVILSQEKRKEIIRNKFNYYKNNVDISLDIDIRNCKLILDEKLLDEVSGLIECPELLIGSIDKKFLEIPSEILSTAIRVHQKYFSFENENEKLAPYFAFVCNIPYNHKEIIKGNEKVLRARLNDAVFFYNQDCIYSLESRLEKLKTVSFHKKGGSLFDKSLRLLEICNFISNNDSDLSVAAKLSKCDLVTEIVTEFPNLQGIMGGYYALNEKLGSEVSNAIREHYMPINAEDNIPNNYKAQILSLADKFDSLVILHIAGEIATGSKDPMALRRTAISIIRIILEGGHRIRINEILEFICSLVSIKEEEKINLLTYITNFIEERLKYYLKSKYDKQYLDSIVNLEKNSDIYDLVKKLEIIYNFAREHKGEEVLRIYNRVVSILNNETIANEVDESLFIEKEEKLLHDSINSIYHKIEHFISKDDYREALNSLCDLAIITNHFFDNVLVNAEDLKITNNRKALLNNVKRLFDLIADFSFCRS